METMPFKLHSTALPIDSSSNQVYLKNIDFQTCATIVIIMCEIFEKNHLKLHIA